MLVAFFFGSDNLVCKQFAERLTFDQSLNWNEFDDSFGVMCFNNI